MGQQAGAFAIWPGQNRLISPDFKKPWDSTLTELQPRPAEKPHAEKSKSHFAPEADETLENHRAIFKNSTLWDGCDPF